MSVLTLNDIQFLCFGGGGLRGGAYIGALTELMPILKLRTIRGCAGTSIGSLVAYMVCSGMHPRQMRQIFLTTSLKPCKEALDLWSMKSLVDLEVFFRDIDKIIAFAGAFDVNITFKDHFAQTHCRLVVVTSALETYAPIILDHTTYPDMPIRTAIQASMSIPGYFPAVKYDSLTLVDGAYTRNFPIHIFPVHQTLGFWLKDVSPKEIDGFKDTLYHSMMCALTTLDVSYYKTIATTHPAHIIVVDVPQKLSLAFNMSEEDAHYIVSCGISAVHKHIISFTVIPRMLLLMLLLVHDCTRTRKKQ